MAEKKNTQADKVLTVGPTCSGPTCPLCTKQGLLLIGIVAILLIVLAPKYHIIAVLPMILAYYLGMKGKLK